MSKLVKKGAYTFGKVVGGALSGTVAGIINGATTPASISARMLENDYKKIDGKRNKIHTVFRQILSLFALSLALASLVYLLQTTDSSDDFLAIVAINWLPVLCAAVLYFLLYFGVVRITAVIYIDEYADAARKHEQRLESIKNRQKS